MREIKFRAWDEKKKRFIQNDTDNNGRIGYCLGEFAIRSNGTLAFYESEEGGMTIIERKDVSISQFTGLRDKNGKEIYEGDILTFDNVKSIVESDEVITGFTAIDEKNTVLPPPDWGVSEVIGNIYENPEMAEAQGGKK